MLPIGKVIVGRDWMEIFTVLVWATVVCIMFISKLKAKQDVLVAAIIILIMLIVNADHLFSRMRWYKVYVVLRKVLKQDCASTGSLVLGCLFVHGAFPESSAPGIALHFSSLLAYIMTSFQASPMVTIGLWAGGRNQMTKLQFMLRVGAQAVGGTLALLVFALYYSFRLPGKGPFNHFFGLESMASAILTCLLSFSFIKVREAREENAKAK